ncbi:MAG: DDE-type integrase/transposase/recombinase [Syntrophobacteraceae bacterium]
MTEEQKKEVATFRFGVIHELVNTKGLSRGEQERLLREKCERRWNIPFSNRTRIGRTTILRWVRLYKRAGGRIESLSTTDRSDRGTTRVMDEETCLSLLALRREFPQVTIKDLISRMRKANPEAVLNPASVYRLLKREGMMKPEGQKCEDRRKYEAELANDIWQSDVLYGPMVMAGAKMRKTYLIAFLDDHSRLVPHGEFYFSEGVECFMDALEKALMKRGLPRKLYTDNGAAFRSHHLEQVCASLGIALIHARPYKPQGKGKIERFFRSVREGFLAGFKGNSLDDLNEAFDLWLESAYHQRKHTSTAQTPFERFTSKIECLRTAPAELTDHFRKLARRRVAKDRTITLNGKIFEGPVSLIGKQVELLYHERDESRVEVRADGRSYGFLPAVDIHVNCRVKRDSNNNPQMVQPVAPKRYRGGNLWSGAKVPEGKS